MKKIVISCSLALFLTGCSDKNAYEQLVLEQMKVDQDIKDYHLVPEEMTSCVIETSSKKMPGLFPLDPERLTAYRNYAKLLQFRTAENKQQALEDLRNSFGSGRALAEANSNYTESGMSCLASLSSKTEQAQVEKEDVAKPKPAN
jgi:hypothetical protein